MRSGRATIVVSLLVLAGLRGVRLASADFGKDEQKFDNAAYPAEFRSRVMQSIVVGANWLLTHQEDNGAWRSHYNNGYPAGPTALSTLALVKAGIPVGHPKIERAFAYLRAQKIVKTYEWGIVLMLLDAKYDPAPDPFAKEEVDRYGNRVVADPCADKISKEDLAWMKQGVDFLVQHQTGGFWRYPDGGFDLSNTQYALLGLKAADRCGLKVPLDVWRSSLQFLLGYQEAEGPEIELRANEVRGEYRIEWKEKAKARGFRYTNGGGKGAMPQTGSMTTAGAAGLMICQSMLWKSRKFSGEEREKTRAAIRDAMAWEQLHFDVTSNPGMGPANHFYYLYGLERMGILAHTRFLGKTDWYELGAEFLMHEQAPSGAWEEGDVVETSFALLFLKRSSFHLANPVITPSDPAPAKGPTTPSDAPKPDPAMSEPKPPAPK